MRADRPPERRGSEANLRADGGSLMMQLRWTYVVSIPAHGATKDPVARNENPNGENEQARGGAWAQGACAVTVTGVDVNPVAVAVTTMLPAAAVERTIARTLPLNALRLVPL